MSAIHGVIVKELTTHADERGFFRELIRVSDDFFAEGFGQWSHSIVYTGAIKAWHLHWKQVDYWYVVSGVLKVALHDLREDSQSYRQTQEWMMGDNHPGRVLKIPPGIAHGCKAIQGPVQLFYITSKTYDPLDELRIPHDDESIGYDWLKTAIG